MNFDTLNQSPRRLSKDGSIHVTDEFYNTLISSFAALLSFLGIFFLVTLSHSTHKETHFISFFIYGFGLLNVFVASALHHGVDGSERTNHLLRQWDYFAISLMIAGTFTPFCLILLRNRMGWTVLGLVWVLALLGIFLKAKYPQIPRWVMTTLFIGMGWLGVVIAKPVYLLLNGHAVFFLIFGGVIFTAGAMIYYFEKPNPLPGRFGFHEIWHLFVVAGAASHFSVMYFYLLPY